MSFECKSLKFKLLKSKSTALDLGRILLAVMSYIASSGFSNFPFCKTKWLIGMSINVNLCFPTSSNFFSYWKEINTFSNYLSMLFWSNKYPSSCQYFRQQSCVMGRNIWLARSKAIWNYSLNKLNFVNHWAFNEKELIFKHISELFTTAYFFIVVITLKNINKKVTNHNE